MKKSKQTGAERLACVLSVEHFVGEVRKAIRYAKTEAGGAGRGGRPFKAEARLLAVVERAAKVIETKAGPLAVALCDKLAEISESRAQRKAEARRAAIAERNERQRREAAAQKVAKSIPGAQREVEILRAKAEALDLAIAQRLAQKAARGRRQRVTAKV